MVNNITFVPYLLKSGWWNLNTKENTIGNPGSLGIGGILRNDQGELVKAFLGMGDSIGAEILGMKGLKVFKNAFAISVIQGGSAKELLWVRQI